MNILRDPEPDAVLVTGGAGFIGCNLAHRLAASGRRVLILDNLSRAGVERNLAWLQATHGDRIDAVVADLRDRAVVDACVARAQAIFHLAAQVAVTTSLDDPAADFAVNAGGTLNLLEAIRARGDRPPLVFTSTNKVYGKLPGIRFVTHGERYVPHDARLAARGVTEAQPLNFVSPYGCSKGAADQYVLDYARTFGLPATVFRMSCIYGPHQFGTEDQGWVAHFLKRVLAGDPITLYGDGRQVRDVLYVDDLVDALLLAAERITALQGDAVNIGGGPENATSLHELLDRLPRLIGRKPVVRYAEWRPGDQPWYVSDTGLCTTRIGWRPRVGIDEGLGRLARWLGATAPAPAAHRVAS
ncbi:SDR family NAD(P)-dependent oxidoreductase [Azospirillum halopraeferens]|uniref:SDR family NAD(P)-dependent oxidoreductase n=1 Tax=Azospirillum halopraeferens TaxID=34010 RepID=UPI00040B782E|nr:SDR family NAD(P)-dependent oxidoreductase [Azospirillum halopraeferens]